MRSMRRLRFACLVSSGLGLGSVGVPAVAHHSFAMFDTAKQVTLDGTVKAFQWTNPHIFVELVVQGDSGPESWSVEGASPNMLFRMGWTPTSIKVGDHLTIVANPLRSGDRGASFIYAKLPNGEVLGTVGYKKP